MFEAFQLHHSFPHRTLFHQLSFRLPKHGLVLITGESGSGKTTFFHALQGLVKVSGKWIVDGVDVLNLPKEQLLEFRQRYIGVMYQKMMLIPQATVLEALEIAAHLKAINLKTQTHLFQESLFKEIHFNQRIATLSLGQKHRLLCYIASLGQPLYYLFDEPTTGLDQHNRKAIYSWISKLSQQTLVMLISHESDEIPCQPILHLHFPLPMVSTKKFFPNIYQRFRSQDHLPTLPIRWMIRYQMRTLRAQKGHFGRQLLQVFFLTIFSVFVSLTSIVDVELKQFSQTMIGGQYRYFQEEKQPPPLKVQSASLADLNPTIHEAMIPQQLASDYDDQFLQSIMQHNQWIVEDGPLKIHLKGFGIHTFNDTQYLPLTHLHDWKHQTLQLDEVILGIEYSHLRELSQLRRVFPTLETLNQSLSFKPLEIIVEVAQPDWDYDDAFKIFLRGVVLANQPTIYHSEQRYNEFIYESRMRLPTKDYAEMYDNEPWRLSKTAALWLADVPRFIESFITSPRCFGFYLKRIGDHKVAIMRSYHQLYGMQKPPNKLHQMTLINNQAGYYYLPQQRLSGFAQPTLLTPKFATLHPFLEAIEVMDHPQAWLDVALPENMVKGHWLNQTVYGIKMHPTNIPLKNDEIILSRALANYLQVKNNDVVYFTSVNQTTIYENLQIERKFFTLPLTIKAIIDGPLMYLYHGSHWLHTMLLIHGDYHSAEFHPQGWAYYGGDDVTIPGLNQVNPHQEVEALFQTWTHSLQIATGLFLLLFGLPTLVGFYSQLKRQIWQERAVLKSLFFQGASQKTTRKLIMMKVKIILSEIVAVTLLSFFVLDYYLKQALKANLWLSQGYRFPLFETGLLVLVFLIFYLIIRAQIINQDIIKET